MKNVQDLFLKSAIILFVLSLPVAYLGAFQYAYALAGVSSFLSFSLHLLPTSADDAEDRPTDDDTE